MAVASFKMSGMGGMEAAFGRSARHMAGSLALTEAIGEQLVSSSLERFESEIGPDGTSWKKSKRVEAEGGQTLSDSGALKGSIAYEATPALVAVGTNKVQAAIHQFGGEIVPKKAKRLVFDVAGKKVFSKKVTMPARPFIGINEEDIEEARETIEEYIVGGFK